MFSGRAVTGTDVNGPKLLDSPLHLTIESTIDVEITILFVLISIFLDDDRRNFLLSPPRNEISASSFPTRNPQMRLILR